MAGDRRAVALLASVLTLAACGGAEEDTDDGAPWPLPELTEESDPAEPGTDGADDAGTADGPGTDRGDGADGTSPGPGSAADAVIGGPVATVGVVSVTWPAGWTDIGAQLGQVQTGAEVVAYGAREMSAYPSGVLAVYSPEVVSGQTYPEMLVAAGAEESRLEELGEREVGGRTVTGLRHAHIHEGFEVVQLSYPVELADGGLAVLTFNAFADDEQAFVPLVEAVLDTVTVDEQDDAAG